MENKEVIGILLNIIVWPLLIYFFFKRKSDERERKNTIKEYNKPENGFEREAQKSKLSLELFSNRSKYPYIIEPLFNEKQNAARAVFIKDKIKIGNSEFMFYKKLLNRFGSNNIFLGNHSLYGYYPDILYIDEATKVYIDIEVDEPYSFETNEPIHYVHIYKDIDEKLKLEDVNKERDKAFQKYGWTVIRFSENQVLKSVDYCCDIINHIINYWALNPSDYNLEKSLISVHKRWTKDEAIKMAAEKSRQEVEIIEYNKTDFDEELKKILSDNP